MIGERLKEARTAAGKTQTEVARAVGVSNVAYLYFERGDKNPSLAVAKQLAAFLGVTLDYLVGN